MHDGKMLYLLTQHCQWNVKHHPFLQCKCARGEGVKNPDHECIWMTQEEQVAFYKKSKDRWESKKKRDMSYDKTKHMKWNDINNYGVSHFGIHPENLHRDAIIFDMFHLKSSVTTAKFLLPALPFNVFNIGSC